MSEDYFTHTEADAGLWARAHAEDYDDDRPSASDLAAEEHAAGALLGQFQYPLDRDDLGQLLRLLRENPDHTYGREGDSLVVRTKDGTND